MAPEIGHQKLGLLRIGLKSKIKTEDDYLKAVQTGVARAEARLKATEEVIPSLDTIRMLHYTMFRDIHPWAGNFRREGEEVRAGDLICTLSIEIEDELKALNAEMLSNPLKGTKKYLTEVIAFYHATLLAIHPFLDGNGRLLRLIMNHQTKMLLKEKVNFTKFERITYINTLRAAQGAGDLIPLTKLINKQTIKQTNSLKPLKAKQNISPKRKLSL